MLVTSHSHPRPAPAQAQPPAKRARTTLTAAAAADAANNAAAAALLLTCDEASASLESPPGSPDVGAPSSAPGSAGSAASGLSSASVVPAAAAAALGGRPPRPGPPTTRPRTSAGLEPAALANPVAVALAFGFSQVAARVGASYFRRLASKDAALAVAAARFPAFATLAGPSAAAAAAAAAASAPGRAPARAARGAGLARAGSAPPLRRATTPPPQHIGVPTSRLGFAAAPAPSPGDGSRLVGVYLACVHVAAKCVERVPYARLLPTMLTWAAGGTTVSPAAAACVELDVLQALEWRLGPFFVAKETTKPAA